MSTKVPSLKDHGKEHDGFTITVTGDKYVHFPEWPRGRAVAGAVRMAGGAMAGRPLGPHGPARGCRLRRAQSRSSVDRSLMGFGDRP